MISFFHTQKPRRTSSCYFLLCRLSSFRIIIIKKKSVNVNRDMAGRGKTNSVKTAELRFGVDQNETKTKLNRRSEKETNKETNEETTFEKTLFLFVLDL